MSRVNLEPRVKYVIKRKSKYHILMHIRGI